MNAASILALAALLALGCRATGAGGAPAIAAGDPAVERRLEILDARTIDAGERRALRLDLRNRSDSELAFAWTVEWFDGSGRPIAAAPAAWSRSTLAAGATTALRIDVPNPDATTWRLRAARPGQSTLSQGDPR